MTTPATVTLTEVMQAIAAQIEAELAIEFEGLQVVPKLVFNPTPPCIDIYPADPFLEQTAYGPGSREATFIVRARVSTADQEGGQELLLELLDPRADSSLIAALAADSTFGGVVGDSSVVDGPSGYIVYENAGGGGALLGAEWRLRVVL